MSLGWARSPLGAIVAVLVVIAVLVARDHSGSSEDQGTPARAADAPVVRAVDGDTILVRLGGEEEYVRYIGVDTPETVKPGTPVQCFGERASAFNHGRVDGQTVHLVFDAEQRDIYGRLLAYVYVGGDFVNADLVKRGFARTLTIAPNTAHESLFARLAERAGRAGLGLWGRC
jgi:micrococcal nuclease